MGRTSAVPIDPVFLRRWSPRAMSGVPLSAETMQTLFEAARWAPSASNKQPWRFVYGLLGTPHFTPLFDLLAEGNREWCVRAGALVVVWSNTVDEKGRPMETASLTTGAALMGLLLQATMLGLVAHPMGGFDQEKAKATIALPEHGRIECMLALGHPGRLEDLSEKTRAREFPSDRSPTSSFTWEGKVSAT